MRTLVDPANSGSLVDLFSRSVDILRLNSTSIRSRNALPVADELVRKFSKDPKNPGDVEELRENFEKLIRIFRRPDAYEGFLTVAKNYSLNAEAATWLYRMIVYRVHRLFPEDDRAASVALFSDQDFDPRVVPYQTWNLRRLVSLRLNRHTFSYIFQRVRQTFPVIVPVGRGWWRPFYAEADQDYGILSALLKSQSMPDLHPVFVTRNLRSYHDDALNRFKQKISEPRFLRARAAAATPRDLGRAANWTNQSFVQIAEKIRNLVAGGGEPAARFGVRDSKRPWAEIEAWTERQAREAITAALTDGQGTTTEDAGLIAQAYCEAVEEAYSAELRPIKEIVRALNEGLFAAEVRLNFYLDLKSRWIQKRAELRNARTMGRLQEVATLTQAAKTLDRDLDLAAEDFARAARKQLAYSRYFSTSMDPRVMYYLLTEHRIRKAERELLAEDERTFDDFSQEELDGLYADYKKLRDPSTLRRLRSLGFDLGDMTARIERTFSLGPTKATKDLKAQGATIAMALGIMGTSLGLYRTAFPPPSPNPVVELVSDSDMFTVSKDGLSPFAKARWDLFEKELKMGSPSADVLNGFRFLLSDLTENDVPLKQREVFRNTKKVLELWLVPGVNAQEFYAEYRKANSELKLALNNLVSWTFERNRLAFSGQIRDPNESAGRSIVRDLCRTADFLGDEDLFKRMKWNLTMVEWRVRNPSVEELRQLVELFQDLKETDIPEDQREIFAGTAGEMYMLEGMIASPKDWLDSGAWHSEYNWKEDSRMPNVVHNILIWSYQKWRKRFLADTAAAPWAFATPSIPVDPLEKSPSQVSELDPHDAPYFTLAAIPLR